MPKLDRTYSTSGNILEQKKEVFHYKGLALGDIGKVFAYLNSVSFNYNIASPPKMDKTIFEEIPMKIIHLNDLRRNKKISGRAKDINDLENLSEL